MTYALGVRLAPLLIAAVVGLSACGDDSDTTTVVETGPTITSPASTATSTTTTGTSSTPDQPDSSFEQFQSPSRNIGCIALDQTVRCDIRERSWAAPQRPADCELDYGNAVSLTAGDAPRFVCAGDTALNDGPVLEYGRTNTVGLLSCTSTEAAMRCRDTETGRGFAISRESYRLF